MSLYNRIVAPSSPADVDAGTEDDGTQDRSNAGEGRQQRAQDQAVRGEVHPVSRGHLHWE